MSDRLSVLHGTTTVGHIWLDDRDRFCFEYDERWPDLSDSFEISLSLPFTEHCDVDGPARHFFANMLPEGALRTLICRRLGISMGNDFALLRAIGGECAGALSIIDPDDAASGRSGYVELAEDDLLEAMKTFSVLPLYSGRRGIRLSLAGAQDKLPVFIDEDRMYLPIGPSPSSHIIKLPGREFGNLPQNEALCSKLAADLGLPVVSVDLKQLQGNRFILIERYDRERMSDGELKRIHQEDMCQCLGLPPTRKYETEGGPSFTDVFEVVSATSVEPATDIDGLVRWLAFNLLVGNCDAHAKNISFLVHGHDRRRLAPFYDLVCTRIYGSLDRLLASSIGGVSDPGQIRGRDWNTLARDIGVGKRWLLTHVEDLIENIHDRSMDIARVMRDEHGDCPVYSTIPNNIRKQARRTRRLLRE